MEDFKDLFRYKLYEKTNILVNDLGDVFKEIKIFIELKLKQTLAESDYNQFIFNSISFIQEDDKFKWRIYLNDELNLNKSIEYDKEFIKKDDDFIKKLNDEYNISMFPKILYNNALIVFTEVVSEYINRNELQEKLELFDILTIDNNGENNIIY